MQAALQLFKPGHLWPVRNITFSAYLSHDVLILLGPVCEYGYGVRKVELLSQRGQVHRGLYHGGGGRQRSSPHIDCYVAAGVGTSGRLVRCVGESSMKTSIAYL